MTNGEKKLIRDRLKKHLRYVYSLIENAPTTINDELKTAYVAEQYKEVDDTLKAISLI
jgi:hypothetical protein